MSFFGEGQYQQAMNVGMFQRSVQALFKVIAGAGWKIKLVIWNDKTEEEWEITPAGSKRTKSPHQHINVEVS